MSWIENKISELETERQKGQQILVNLDKEKERTVARLNAIAGALQVLREQQEADDAGA